MASKNHKYNELSSIIMPDDLPKGVSHDSIASQMHFNGVLDTLDLRFPAERGIKDVEMVFEDSDVGLIASFEDDYGMARQMSGFIVKRDVEELSFEHELARWNRYLIHVAGKLDQDLIGDRRFIIKPLLYRNVHPVLHGFVSSVEFSSFIKTEDYVTPIELVARLSENYESLGDYAKALAEVMAPSLFERRIETDSALVYASGENPVHDHDFMMQLNNARFAIMKMLHENRHARSHDRILAEGFDLPGHYILDSYKRIFLDYSTLTLLDDSAKSFLNADEHDRTLESTAYITVLFLDVVPSYHG